MKAIEKKMAKQTLAGVAVVAVGVFGCIQVFTKGVDRLPDKVCSGAVDRDIAADVLPHTMTATERGERGVVDSLPWGTVFYCYVKTRSQDSILSGEVEVGDVTLANWRDPHSGGDEGAREVRRGGVDAMTTPEGVSVYVPCIRPGQEGQKPLQSYALIADARVVGDARVTGVELQQHVADFAYQILRHTYEVEKCQEGQELPVELPRFE
ncbi:hypothetical protein ACIRD8_07810 [Streptomyces sp. NPDC102451]|uniref:hypothetical protein n=1 Tax=Streptomyces sp. NPDC102451 TaxID=3366177 RepID=UPI003807E25F